MLRILHLEDDPADALLVAETLRQDGIPCNPVVVATRVAFEEALDRGPFDLILADYQLPAFDGLTAQTLAAERVPDVPFIFVSGTLGEEIAVERLKSGAYDYVLKQRLARLPSSVRRALSEAEALRQQRKAEVELRQLNVDLDARVARRTSELASANAALAIRERQLRESEGRLQAILDHSPATISVKDLAGRFVLVNRRFEAAAGRSSAEVIGRTDADLFGPRLAEIYQANDRQVLETEGPVQMEEPALESGNLRIYASSKFPLLDSANRPYAVCGISLDVTERRHAEESMKLAAIEADRANRAKSEFLSRMSHDFRTPLNAILGFAQLLENSPLTPDQRESVLHMTRGGRQLLGLVNEVLDIARIESGRLSVSREPVSVADVVHELVGLVGPLAKERAISLACETIDSSQYVAADRQRLTEILLNLLSNAIKYNRPSGRVTITYRPVGDNRLRVGVTDTGFGISDSKQRLLFQPFERLGAEHTAIEGTGLGLAMSRGLAEAMGATLGFATEVGVGSTFWIDLERAASLPVTVPPSKSEPSAMSADVARVRGTVLYIEDNTSNVTLMQRILQRRRPAVSLLTARSGQQGIDLVRTAMPGIVLLDLHLPDMSGEDVLRDLSQNPTTRSVPVVVLSADATPNQAQRLEAYGARGYLTKPFEIDRILETMDTYLTSPNEHA